MGFEWWLIYCNLLAATNAHQGILQMVVVNPASTILPHLIAFIMPLNMIILFAPLVDIPPQMCIFAGCCGRCFNDPGSLSFLKHSLPW